MSLSNESQKKLISMLTYHQMFRRLPRFMFESPGSAFWAGYIAAMKSVVEDKDLNMDFRWTWRMNLRGVSYVFPPDSVAPYLRPAHPRLMEAYQIVSRETSSRDRKDNTVFFQNACKEYPVKKPEEALYIACKEAYLAVDRALYFYVKTLDAYYGTDFSENTLEYIAAEKRKDPAYRRALDFLRQQEEQGLDVTRSRILQQELEAYSAIVKLNHEKRLRHIGGVYKEYKGIDVTWADDRLPSDYVIRKEFTKGLVAPLLQAVAENFAKENGTRRYEALLDKIEYLPVEDRHLALAFYASDILYGFEYTRLHQEQDSVRIAAEKLKEAV